MAEQITWLPSRGYVNQNDAWKEALAFQKEDKGGMFGKLRGLGYDIQLGVRKKNAKWYPVIIYNK